MPSYSIIIPTYNHCDDYLRPCVESIFKYTSMADVELIISANGCVDSTREYLQSLLDQFGAIGFEDNLKIVWRNEPLGFAKAVNEAIKVSTAQKIVLLNNDTVLLPQAKNTWIQQLAAPFVIPECGISAPIVQYSPEAGSQFAVFFCVMIDRKVFDRIGLLNEEYGVGGGEDTEFCIEALKAGFHIYECVQKQILDETHYTGSFPIYHKGEGTMFDTSLVKDWKKIYDENGLRLAKKYNREMYKFMLQNNFERYLTFKGEEVGPREKARYLWAAANRTGSNMLEIGCSNGYGSQFFPDDIDYLGLDYDEKIVKVATDEGWGPRKKFVHADINTFDLEFYDTIVAFEVLEHVPNGLELAQRLKNHCNTLLVSVPYKEEPGFWGEHHVLHQLDESHLPGFTEFAYVDADGNVLNSPNPSTFNLLLAKYTR